MSEPRNIFQAECGKFHLIDDGTPVGHKCAVARVPSSVSQVAVQRTQNPINNLPIRSRIDEDRFDGQRASNPAEDEEVEVRRLSSDRMDFQQDRNRGAYRSNPVPQPVNRAPNPHEDWHRGREDSRMHRAAHYERSERERSKNPCDCQCPERSSNPVQEGARDSEERANKRRCDILAIKYSSKHPNSRRPSCDELEREEGPAYDESLRKVLMKIPPHQREKIAGHRYRHLLHRANPVSEEAVSAARSPMATSVPPPAPAHAKEPSGESSVSAQWRSKCLKLTDGMQQVLAQLRPRRGSYLATLQSERSSKVSLSMIDGSLQDIAEALKSGSMGADKKPLLVALEKDLRQLRRLWREFAMLKPSGRDNAKYNINESSVKL